MVELPYLELVEPAATSTINITGYNFLERLWAYLSVHSLLRRVELGELYSCQPPQR